MGAADRVAIKNYVPDDEPENERMNYEVSGHLKPGFKRPLIIHRAILGSVERFTAIIGEHLGGKWPFWLNPKQALVVPISLKFSDYATQVKNRLSLEGFDVDVDLSKLTLNNKVRKAQLEQYSYILCCGQKDLDSGSVTIRLRDQEKDIGSKSISEVIQMFKDQLPAMSSAQLAKINNSYYSPEEKMAQGNSTDTSQMKKLNDELLLKAFLGKDGFTFSEKDIIELEKLNGADIDKGMYPNVYRWSMMVRNMMSAGGNAPQVTAPAKKVTGGVLPVEFKA